MKAVVKISVLAATVALSGCAFSSYCEGEQDYQAAPSYPPLQTVEGVKLPDSQAALRIPPPPKEQVAFGETYKDEDGDDAVRCLDKPPALPPLVEPKPADAKPPEAKPAETPAQPG